MPKKTKSTKSPETPNTATNAPAQEPRSSKKTTTRPGKRIISIAVDEKLASRLALLARAEGVSVTQLITDAVSKNLKGRISAALEGLKADLEA
jgi:Ribbon-helix-helix protein, copG family